MDAEDVIAAFAESHKQITESVASAVRSWTKDFPEDQLRSALASLEDLRRDMGDTIEAFSEALEAVRQLRASSNGNGNGRGRGTTKRRAILELLGQNPDADLKLSEIKTALVERGILPETNKAAHALQMTLQNMYRRYGEVERPRPGFYRLAPRGAKSVLPTNVQSRDGEVERPGEGPGNVAPDPSLATERVATR